MALGALEGAGCGCERGIFSSRRDLPVTSKVIYTHGLSEMPHHYKLAFKV